MITLEQLYACVEGDLNEVIGRLGGNENMVRRFLKRFLDDNSFSLLKTSLENNDVKSAFRGAHSLKGVAATLGLEKLYEITYAITELLRAENLDEAKKSFPEIEKEYNQTCDLIKELA